MNVEALFGKSPYVRLLKAFLVTSDLSDFVNYVEETIPDWHKRAKKWRRDIKKGKLDPGSSHVGFLEWEFPRRLRYAVVVTVHSALEFELKRICEMARRETGAALAYGDIRGSSSIERTRVYLEKVVRVGLSVPPDLWHEIRFLSELRNVIVHADGIDSDGRIRKLLPERQASWTLARDPFSKKPLGAAPEFLTLADDNEITVHADYCRLIAHEVREFFLHLYDAKDLPITRNQV